MGPSTSGAIVFEGPASLETRPPSSLYESDEEEEEELEMTDEKIARFMEAHEE